MKKTNNNLIYLFIVLAFVVTFSFASPANAVYIYSFTAGSGAIADQSSIPSNYNNNYTNPSPVITSISPSSAYQCSGSKIVNIYGSNFTPTSVARWNGSNIVTTYKNSSNLEIQLNSTDICSTLGNYLVTVYNDSPGGGLSNGAYFTIKTPPSVTSTTSKTTTATPKATTAKTTAKPKTVAKAVTCETDSDKSGLGLTANALFGADGFMPTNIFQWFILFIMVLLIVILARKIMAKKDKPLKHS